MSGRTPMDLYTSAVSVAGAAARPNSRLPGSHAAAASAPPTSRPLRIRSRRLIGHPFITNPPDVRKLYLSRVAISRFLPANWITLCARTLRGAPMSDLRIASANGPPATIDEPQIQALLSALRGDLILPGAARYAEARTIFNAMIDKRPALIARCAGASHVV